MESLLAQLDREFEVYLDDMSTDGSQKILKEYNEKGLIHLVRKKSSRGIGRQVALKNSRGKYIISGLDMDDTFRPIIKELIKVLSRQG